MPDSNIEYAVIFTSVLNEDAAGYHEAASEMEEMVRKMPGFLGMDSSRTEVGITVCYWDSLEAIENWKNQEKHREARESGKKHWYKMYDVKVCKVLMHYAFT